MKLQLLLSQVEYRTCLKNITYAYHILCEDISVNTRVGYACNNRFYTAHEQHWDQRSWQNKCHHHMTLSRRGKNTHIHIPSGKRNIIPNHPKLLELGELLRSNPGIQILSPHKFGCNIHPMTQGCCVYIYIYIYYISVYTVNMNIETYKWKKTHAR